MRNLQHSCSGRGQESERLGSEGGQGQEPRALSKFREQPDSRFPDSSKTRAEVRGAASVQMARGFHGETHRRSSNHGEGEGLVKTRERE